jgi:hypothetical protein
MMRNYSLWVVILFFFLLAGCRVILEESPQPPTLEPVIIVPATQTASPQPTAEPTPEPTQEPTQELSLHALPTATPEPRRPFSVLADAPIQTIAFLHTDKGCGWMGVAGQVFAISGEPLPNVVVIVVGNVAGNRVDALGFAGLAPGYGPGGFEIKLSDSVAPGIFWIQIFDLGGTPLADPYSFQMTGGCEKNLTLINFRQMDANYRIVLPLVQR